LGTKSFYKKRQYLKKGLIMKKKSKWVKGKEIFESSMEHTKKDRVFTLTNIKTGKVISFESWQAAQKQGYSKK
jgi:hypothetical protein